MTLSSRIMIGEVRHRRFTPSRHDLNYGLFMPCIDLDEWHSLKTSVWGLGESWWHWARLKRADYVGEKGDFKAAVQDKVHELTGTRVSGKVVALIHLRYLGMYFSPVNFYYLYDESGKFRYLLAEVSNTPWNERHYYAVSADEHEPHNGWQQPKTFHVSPFNPIDQGYQWKIRPLTDKVFVHLECHRNDKEFDATLLMKGVPFTTRQLFGLLLKTPVMTIKVVAGIYWEAFKLWRKKVPIYDHPER